MRTTERAAASTPPDEQAGFAAFVTSVEPGLRRALVARLGVQAGRDATVDALAYAWENWQRLAAMENPAGYLYRVAARAGGRATARARRLPPPDHSQTSGEDPEFEPRLPAALARLTPKQRTAVLLVHGWHYSLPEAATQLDMSESSVRTHIARGLARLRRDLGGAR